MNHPKHISPHYSQSWNFLQHLQTAALLRKAEIRSNLATCLATSIPDRDSSHCFSHLTKRIAYDWQSLNFDSAKVHSTGTWNPWPVGTSSILELMVPALQIFQRRVTLRHTIQCLFCSAFNPVSSHGFVWLLNCCQQERCHSVPFTRDAAPAGSSCELKTTIMGK